MAQQSVGFTFPAYDTIFEAQSEVYFTLIDPTHTLSDCLNQSGIRIFGPHINHVLQCSIYFPSIVLLKYIDVNFSVSILCVHLNICKCQ